MTTMMRDLMLVCRNGHIITDRLKARPDLRLPRCDRCGADTLDRCETCGHLFAGANPVPGFEPIGFQSLPKTCTTCGAPFPWAKAESPEKTELVDKLELLLRRLPRVAEELASRPGSPFAVRRERNLDDLVRVLLPLHFNDIRPETRTPIYSTGPRTSFVLPEIDAVVVPQFVSLGIDEGEIERRRVEDVQDYLERPGCATLLFFVHDPERRLYNPERLEAVGSKGEGRLKIQCVIAS